MSLIMVYVSTGIIAILGLYILSRTKRVYENGKVLLLHLSIGWWVLDIAWMTIVTLSSLYNI